jgi:hypothetical protein
VPVLPESVLMFMRIAGIGILIWVLMRNRTKQRRRTVSQVSVGQNLKHNANATGQHQTFTGTASLGAPADVLKWQIELHDLGRELKAELDSKLIAVRAMTQSYDQATNRLKDMIRAAQQLKLSDDSPLLQVQKLAAEGWSETRIAQVLGLSQAEVETLLEMPARN